MNIVGYGIDIIEVAALQRWIDDPRNPLIPRVFTEAELAEIGNGPNRIDHLAGRFAAKEAVLKALGRGFGAGIAFTDVTIHRAAGAPPKVQLSGGAVKAAAELGATEWWLSISHAGKMAIASVVALGPGAQSDISSRD